LNGGAEGCFRDGAAEPLHFPALPVEDHGHGQGVEFEGLSRFIRNARDGVIDGVLLEKPLYDFGTFIVGRSAD
jgi:hypothetical protein